MEGRRISAGSGEIGDAAGGSVPAPPEPVSPETEALVTQIRDKARNLYISRQLLCTEAVMVALNQGLNGGLSETQAVAMAAPFCVALGESGCLCGALAGAVLASGLFLGRDRPFRRRGDMRVGARELHDAFKAANGATCCRVLTKKVRHDPDAHFRQCADLTADGAEMAARLILGKRPELIRQANGEFLARRQSAALGVFHRILQYLSG